LVDIYLRKKRWKWFLFGAAVVIVAVSLYYTNILVNQIRSDERKNVEIWAEAIHRKADLVNFTNMLFEQIRDEERRRVVTLAEAQKRMITSTSSDNLDFFLDIIQNNTTIPVIQIDDNGNIISMRNTGLDPDKVKKFDTVLMKEYSLYPPIIIKYYQNRKVFLYYKDSNIFSELRKVLDDLIRSFFSEVVLNSASVPVIITDSTKRNVLEHGNVKGPDIKDDKAIAQTLQDMEDQNTPIRVNLADTGVRYIFYKDSFLLTQLKYYPYVQFLVIGLFLLIAYLLFSYARRSEQNQVWVGMARETAHQLGTPLSSMSGWIELLKLKGVDQETLNEIEKDVMRLETITDRFSKIGAAARLEKTDIIRVVHDTIDYIRARTSPKVTFTVNPPVGKELIIPLNTHLFEWVIENLCKNAVDAMEGSGKLSIEITEDTDHIHIDVADTGRGIPKSRQKTIFNPGYTSKQRGWGLGLTLSRRIVENYHKGKIFVRNSALNKGTTFRIILKR
jgi:two-component system, sporulation sensor kinase D